MIDWRQLGTLREEVGAEDFDEIVQMFLEEVEEALTRLGDGPDLAADLHFLKGSALNLGFVDLSQLCALAETRAITGGAVDTSAVCQVFDASKSAFLDGLPALLAGQTNL